MKLTTRIAALTLLFSFLSITASMAQRARSSRSNDDTPVFTVGIAPLSFLTKTGNFKIHGEWAYASNKSVSLLVNLPRPTKLPDWLVNNIAVDDTNRLVSNKYSSVGVIAEHRFYLGQRAPRGFYLAPYARYNRFSVTRTTENPSNNGETKLTGAVGGFGLGAAAGAQFSIGEQVFLDFTIVGLDFKLMRGTLKYTTNDPENNLNEFRDKVQEQVGDIPFIGKKLVAQLEGDEIKVHTPGFLLPALRFNFTANYRF